MSNFGLNDWKVVSTKRTWPVLLVGNGASRAVSKRFAYDSLYNVAPLTRDDRDLFDALGTRNFEEVLNHLRTAILICEQVGHDQEDVQDRYSSIRDALITAVHDHHVDWDEADAKRRLGKIRRSLRDYESVFTTSYDLLIYWAMMNAGSPPGDGFGDLFWNSTHSFDPFDTEGFGNKTLVYWLHGGLHLYRGRYGETAKRTRSSENILATIASSGGIPLFVSEGTSRQKRHAIRRSDYLEHVFKVFADAKDNLVVFGQALGREDNHLVQVLRQARGRNVAYGIYPTTQHNVNLQIAQIEKKLPYAKLTFFDSRTHPLGDPKLIIPSP